MKVEGLSRFNRMMKALPEEVRAEMSKAIRKSADEVAKVQRRSAPRRSGRLVASIEVLEGGTNKFASERAGMGLSFIIRAGGATTSKPVRKSAKNNAPFYDYALAAEFGNTRQAARPFFYGPFRLLKKRAKARYRRSFKKAVGKAKGA